MIIKWWHVLILTVLAGYSCRKDKTLQPSNTGQVQVQIRYNFDGQKAIADTVNYTCAAGYKMSFTRLQYYLSGIRFYKSDGGIISLADVHYVSFKDSATNSFTCTLPKGDYAAVSFNIGLDSAINKTGFLPSTNENLNMEWPDMMGGGYHFLKLEGYYIDATGRFGYAVHLGKNKNLVSIPALLKIFTISNNTNSISLDMNIAEWLKNPVVYDFDKDGNFTMNNDAAMAKIATNGTDVFK
jgi:hypothetical protein